MALIKSKQIDPAAFAGAIGAVRHRVPSDVVLAVPDGFQYVVHTTVFPVAGEVFLEGDAELIING